LILFIFSKSAMNSALRLQLWDKYTTPSQWNFSLPTTKLELQDILSKQQSDSITTNHTWWYVINHISEYIPLSVVRHWEQTAIDSVVQLHSSTTDKIYNKVQETINKNTVIWQENITLSIVQTILDEELGIISDVSSAESEQQQAIEQSDNGIIKSNNLSQKMCTLRAGYTAQVLSKLWWEATTLCGNMEGKWHARNILKSPSGEKIMMDPMNPNTGQWYRFVNSTILPSSSTYDSLKNWSYTWSLKMNGNEYNMNIAA
jgi:hypothetical protein